MNRNFAVWGLVLLLAIAGGPAHAVDAKAVPDRSVGKADAPVVVQEFVSFTCPHCAAFYDNLMPTIEKDYIDTGKVRLILRDFPMDGLGLRAAALARCMPEDQYFPFVKVLFKNQQAWVTATDPTKTLIQYAKLGGLSEDKAKSCLDDQGMLDALVAARTDMETRYKVAATPSLVFNDGAKQLAGPESIAQFSAIVDPLVAQAKK